MKLTNMLSEANIKPFLSKPTDPESKIPPVILTLERKTDAYTGYYRLETDKWFRRYQNPGRGYGLMIRKIKVTAGPKPYTLGFDTPTDKYLVTLTYLPNAVPDGDESDYETAKGYIMITGDAKNNITGKDVERFVNANVSTYEA